MDLNANKKTLDMHINNTANYPYNQVVQVCYVVIHS